MIAKDEGKIETYEINNNVQEKIALLPPAATVRSVPADRPNGPENINQVY